MIVPVGAKTFKKAIRWSSEIFYNLREILIKNKLSISVGDEGGFSSRFKNNEQPLEYLIKAIKAAGLNPEKEVMISLDVAASEFYKNNLYTMSSEKNN